MSEADIVLEPIQVRIRKAPLVTGESVMTLYDAVRKGELDLIKDDAGHSYLLYEQLKARCAARKRCKPEEKPHLAAARDAYHAGRREEKARLLAKQQTRKRKASR